MIEQSISLNVIISVASGILGAIGAYIRLKSTMDINKVRIENLDDENKSLHKRIDSVKATVEINREKQDSNYQQIKTEMSQMELRIIQAIHEIKKT